MPSSLQQANLIMAVPAAQASAKQWKVPASVTLAQWILESAWGLSKLSTQANNYFGIKAEHLDQPDTYVEFKTTEYSGQIQIADFQKYASEADSFEDHARLLATAARYQRCMAVANNPAAFAMMLQPCGYSTSEDPETHAPNYGTKLLTFMRLYNLYQYDVETT